MTLRSDGRRVISATMQPELYDRLYAHCKELDIPVTVFVREAISKALPAEKPRPKGSQLLAYARAVTSGGEQQPPVSHSWVELGGRDFPDVAVDP